MNKLCPAKLQSGKPCKFKGKEEYSGYCGIHAIKKQSQIDDHKLALIIATGSALLTIYEKALEHLPAMIDLITHVSSRALLSPLNDLDDELKSRVRIEKVNSKILIKRYYKIFSQLNHSGNKLTLKRLLQVQRKIHRAYLSCNDNLPLSLYEKIEKAEQDLVLAIKSAGIETIEPSYKSGPLPPFDSRYSI